jgi:hypothetical protein
VTVHEPRAVERREVVAEEEARAERRAAVRTPASDLPRPIACRITPGRDVRVVNLSAMGMLVESTSPLFPGRTVKLHLQVDAATVASIDARIDAPIVAPIDPRRVTLTGTVVRGHMATVDRDHGATFVSAIAFERRLDLARELSP